MCKKKKFPIEDTQSFPKKVRDFLPLENKEEDECYEVESLFTKIPVKETVNHILYQIYIRKAAPQICSRRVFKRLLMKLATEVAFTFNKRFCKQIDGCTMGGHLSVTVSVIYIYLVKIKIEVARPLKPLLYSRYAEDIYNRRKKNESDKVYYALNNYHENIKLTIEISPLKFLDTQLINEDGKYITKYYRKERKITIH